MNLLITILLWCTPPTDTVAIKYTNDSIWHDGFMITNVIKQTDLIIVFDPPTGWLDINKQSISKPSKYHMK